MGGFYEQNMDLLLAGTGGLLWKVLRRQVVDFSQCIGDYVDQLSQGKLPQSRDDEDTLDSKLLMKLDKLADLTVSETKAQTSLKAELHQWLPPHIRKESVQESARAKPPRDSRRFGYRQGGYSGLRPVPGGCAGQRWQIQNGDL